MNILFVCTGNTCRSPMAEALLSEENPSLQVKSAGLFAIHGQAANRQTIAALKEKDINREHRSQPITQQLLEWADFVFTMTIQQKQSLFFQFPHYQEKYFTLKEFVGAGDQATWNKLRKLYEKLEKQRALFIQKHEHKVGNVQLQEKLADKFQEAIQQIERLEADVRSYDISDPFGGDLSVYRQTMHELEADIRLLNEKLSNLENH